MLAHHKDHYKRFEQQIENSKNYVLPFIEQSLELKKGLRVMEMGCGEGGVMKPLAQMGCECLGLDLDAPRLKWGEEYMAENIAKGNLKLIYKNVYDEDFVEEHQEYFDLIILKDVIEHLPNQADFLTHFQRILKPGGQIFFGFPPWQMPFGGHQQVLNSKLSKVPYIHLLPGFIYFGLMKSTGESEAVIEGMREIKDTRISIERFERIVKQTNYEIVNKQWFLINPIYKYKFGLKPRKQNWLFGAIPWVRNFLTTCAYYSIKKA